MKHVETFSHWLAEYLPDRRNKPAHGSNDLLGESWGLLDLCADVTNQVLDPCTNSKPVFPEPEPKR